MAAPAIVKYFFVIAYVEVTCNQKYSKAMSLFCTPVAKKKKKKIHIIISTNSAQISVKLVLIHSE